MRTIYRTDKNPESGNTFTRIDNRVINDTKLTPAARLALCYLLSKPDDWSIQDHDLRRYLEVGIKKLQAVIQELRDAGYLDRQQRKDDQGRWYTTSTLVFEDPELNRAVGQKPSNGEPLEAAENATVGQKPSRRLPSDGNGSDGNGWTVNVQYTNNGVTNDESPTTERGTTEGETTSANGACIAHDASLSSSLEKIVQRLLEIGTTKTRKTAERDAKSLLKSHSEDAILAACTLAVIAEEPNTKYIRGILKKQAAAAVDNTPVGIYRRETGIKGDIKPAIVEWLETESRYGHYTPEFLAAVIRHVDNAPDYDGLSIFNRNDFDMVSDELREPVDVFFRPTPDNTKFIIDDIKRKAGDRIPFDRESKHIQSAAVKMVVDYIKREHGVDAVCGNFAEGV